MKLKPWLIVGAGAIGLLWASRLSKLGYPVHLVYRSESPGAFLTLESHSPSDAEPSSEQFSIQSFTHTELDKKYGKVLLCTKSYDLVAAYLSVKPHIKKKAMVACLCNGLGAQQALFEQLGPKQTLWVGVTSEGALKLASNQVKHTGEGDTYFGLWDDSRHIKAFPIEHYIIHNIHQKLIEKLAVNAIINPITGAFRVQNGDLLEQEFTQLKQHALEELARLFSHPGFSYYAYSQHLNLDTLTHRVNTVAQLTRLNRSSMHEDLRLNRKTEVDYICGFLIENSPIELPYQSLLLKAILAQTEEQREQAQKKLLSIT
ncbi:ketopantoate reductase family protein [Marinomonas epiphytica]